MARFALALAAGFVVGYATQVPRNLRWLPDDEHFALWEFELSKE